MERYNLEEVFYDLITLAGRRVGKTTCGSKLAAASFRYLPYNQIVFAQVLLSLTALGLTASRSRKWAKRS